MWRWVAPARRKAEFAEPEFNLSAAEWNRLGEGRTQRRRSVVGLGQPRHQREPRQVSGAVMSRGGAQAGVAAHHEQPGRASGRGKQRLDDVVGFLVVTGEVEGKGVALGRCVLSPCWEQAGGRQSIADEDDLAPEVGVPSDLGGKGEQIPPHGTSSTPGAVQHVVRVDENHVRR